MKKDYAHHRERAQLDYIKLRRILAEASALLHQADVIKDGLGKHLLRSGDDAPGLYEVFVEYVSDDFHDAKVLLGSIEEKLYEGERDLHDLDLQDVKCSEKRSLSSLN